MYRLIFIVATYGLLVISPQSLVHAQVAPDVAAQAAQAFANRLATPGSVTHTRAFQGALNLATQLETPRTSPGGRAEGPAFQNRGDLSADPRYNANVDAMLGNVTTKIWRGQRTSPGTYPDTVAIQ